MNFTDLGLSPSITDVVTKHGYQKPTPIQAEAIPAILAGHDVLAAAQTGTGKTAGFALPLIEKLTQATSPVSANHVRALVLTPTRELAAQVSHCIATYSQGQSLRHTVVFGGVKINPQMMRLRKGVDILVATPGRLLDLAQQNAIQFNQLNVLVLDEADRMLDMGFIRDIRKIMALLPPKRQNLLFSATFSSAIRDLAKGLVKNPVEIAVAQKNATAELVTHWIHPTDKKRKPALLSHLIKQNDWQQVLVFSRTKHGANRLAQFLQKQQISATAIHGNKSQGARTKALANFKSGSIRVLVATDIAARGLDINQLPYVVNVDLPHVAEDYVHRIGRTGRANTTGQAISLVSEDEFKSLVAIERLIQQPLDRVIIDTFSPTQPLPESPKNLRAPKRKRPKKKINGKKL